MSSKLSVSLVIALARNKPLAAAYVLALLPAGVVVPYVVGIGGDRLPLRADDDKPAVTLHLDFDVPGATSPIRVGAGAVAHVGTPGHARVYWRDD